MQGLARLQPVGPLVLFYTVGMTEAAAYALADAPLSALLWCLNLEVSGIFRKCRAFLADYGGLPFEQLMLAAPLALLAMVWLTWVPMLTQTINAHR